MISFDADLDADTDGNFVNISYCQIGLKVCAALVEVCAVCFLLVHKI